MARVMNFMAGFMVGIALGGAAAALMVPDSGSEMRARFRERIRRALEEGNRAADVARADAYRHMAELKESRTD
jgi:gas vesicle protein